MALLLGLGLSSLPGCDSRAEREAEAAAQYDRGVAALAAGDEARARTALEAALELEPDHVQAWRALASAALLERDVGAYLVAGKRLLELEPSDTRNAEHVVASALKSGQVELAHSALAVLEEQRPRAPITLMLGARLAFEEGQLTRARKLATAALRENADLAEAHHILGRTAEANGRDTSAAESYGQALRSDPGHLGARDAVARLWARDGKPARAAEHRRLHSAILHATERRFRTRPAEDRAHDFQVLVDEMPAWVLGRIELGRALLELDRAQEAREVLEPGLEHDAANVGLHQLLGRALRELGQEQAAQRHIAAALALGGAL